MNALHDKEFNMARKVFGSPVYQAVVIMQADQAFGKKLRRAAERDGTSAWKFFSSQEMKSYISAFARFLHFCRSRFSERYAGKTTSEMARAYICHLADLSWKPDDISKECKAIERGDLLMRRLGWKTQDAPPLIVEGLTQQSD